MSYKLNYDITYITHENYFTKINIHRQYYTKYLLILRRKINYKKTLLSYPVYHTTFIALLQSD